jgi:hypothetical protein
MTTQTLMRLQDLWDEPTAAALAGHPLELLRYRSNLLGEDLRITNFGGGNTSSKFELADPAVDCRRRLCGPVHGQARSARRALSR